MQEKSDHNIAVSSDRIAGLALAGAAVFSVVTMSHHPSGHEHGSHLGEIVHGIMIVLVLGMMAGFARVGLRLGLDRFSVVAGLVAYGAATIGQVLAASINGFITVTLARDGIDPMIAKLLWTMNQTFAYGAVYLTGAAFFLFSVALWQAGGALARLAAVVGIASGIAPVLLLASDVVDMHVSGAFIVYAILAAFTFLVGLWLTFQARNSG